MNHLLYNWVLLFIGSIAVGAALVGLLVVRKTMEPFAALMGAIGAGAALLAFSRLVASYPRPDAVLWMSGVVIAATGGGYALASTMLHLLERPLLLGRDLSPAAVKPSPTPVVIVVACIEPDSYDPHATAAMLRHLSDEGLLDSSIAALPFIFFAQKTRYRIVGGKSPAEQGLSAITDRLATVLTNQRARVLWATCSGGTALPVVVERALKDGHRSITILPLAIASSPQLAHVLDLAGPHHIDGHDAVIDVTEPLFDAERILLALSRRIPPDPSRRTGVVVVGHGQPPASSHDSAFDEQETVFLTRLRMMIAETGVDEHAVMIAWMDWGNPDVATALRHVAASGCTRIYVVPATWPLDTLSTRLDFEIAVRQTRLDGVDIVTLGALNHDEAVIEELRTRAVASIERIARRAG